MVHQFSDSYNFYFRARSTNWFYTIPDIRYDLAMNPPVGVLEGFFGSPWPHEARLGYADFLKSVGMDFYIYAPKTDPFLRKRWLEPHPSDQASQLRDLSHHYKKSGAQFGIALSPFEVFRNFGKLERSRIAKKVQELNQYDPDILAVFFDDMAGVSDNTGCIQAEVLDVAVRETNAKKVITIGSYYSDDPILDKVFGQRPLHYLRDFGIKTDRQVDIMWTGPKTISEEMPPDYIDKVAQVLRRKPFLWDNFAANDGPKNCKYLKLQPVSGRPAKLMEHISGWAVNPMNQAELSKIPLYSLYLNLTQKDAYDSGEVMGEIMDKLQISEPLQRVLTENYIPITQDGLEKINSDDKDKWLQSLSQDTTPMALEFCKWLKGEYTVDSECLTD